MAETDVTAQGIVAGSTDNPKPAADGNPQGLSDWAKDLDEGLKKKVEKFKSPADLAKGYVELETYSSKTLQDMTDAEKEKFFKRLALPEKPEDYELSTIALPQGIERSKGADDDFKAFVHEAKLTKDQAKRLHEWSMKRFSDAVTVQRAAEKKATEERDAALRAEWGTSFDANHAAIAKVIALGGDEFVKYMNGGPGKDAVVRKGLYAISKLFADETLVSGKVQVGAAKTEARPGFVFDISKSPELLETRR